MGFKRKLVNQVRNPSGKIGRIIARGMNKGHAKLAEWGLSKIVINPNDIILHKYLQIVNKVNNVFILKKNDVVHL